MISRCLIDFHSNRTEWSTILSKEWSETLLAFFSDLTCRGCCDEMRLTRTMFKETWKEKSVRQSIGSWYALTPLRRFFCRFDERLCWLNDRTFTFLIVLMKSVLCGAGSSLAFSQTSHTILLIENLKMNSFLTSHGFHQWFQPRNVSCLVWPDQHRRLFSRKVIKRPASERERNHQGQKEALNLSLVVCQQR